MGDSDPEPNSPDSSRGLPQAVRQACRCRSYPPGGAAAQHTGTDAALTEPSLPLLLRLFPLPGGSLPCPNSGCALCMGCSPPSQQGLPSV